jgi:hypothetical protein
MNQYAVLKKKKKSIYCDEMFVFSCNYTLVAVNMPALKKYRGSSINRTENNVKQRSCVQKLISGSQFVNVDKRMAICTGIASARSQFSVRIAESK